MNDVTVNDNNENGYENKPPSVIAVLVCFYRHSKSPHSFSFIFHFIYGVIIIIVIIIYGCRALVCTSSITKRMQSKANMVSSHSQEVAACATISPGIIPVVTR